MSMALAVEAVQANQDAKLKVWATLIGALCRVFKKSIRWLMV